MASLLNRSAVKQHIKDRFELKRPHIGITRVSERALDEVEASLRIMIDKAIHAYPSRGKTFLYFV